MSRYSARQMMMKRMMIEISNGMLDEMIREQLRSWPLAADNYAVLSQTERRPVMIGAMEGAIQCNPRRIVSTGASVDRTSIASRPCFLCDGNRPVEQYSLPYGCGGDEWEILVNPYPILPTHFTVSNRNHKPQGMPPLEMVSLAERLPGMVCFFNGASAGASAPDHEHFQMTLRDELPLIKYLESGADIAALPYRVDYVVVTPDMAGLEMIRRFGTGRLAEMDEVAAARIAGGLFNAYAWLGHDGLMRLAIVRRRAHRPRCYSAPEPERIMVSPGAIDMAGLVILPRKGDFDKISERDLDVVFGEV